MQFAKLPSENKTTSNRNARFFKSGGSNKRSFFDVQPKLKIGAPNDPYEKEADRVADRVVSDKGGGLINAKNYSIQRKCNSCEEEEAVQAKQNTNGTTPSFNHNNFKNQLNSCSNEGSKMESSVQRKMSSKMGADFGKVRIHTGNNAQQMSTSINAKAFTHGHNIYFNQGQYNPSSKEGTRLLAHELTHVIQQNGGSKAIQRDLAIPLPNPNAATPELSDTQIQDAIEYNQRHMRNAEEIRVTRDVLGLSHDQPTIDTAFVNAVARFQARNFITADGKIGRVTSARLSREFTAERQHLDRDESRDLYRASRRMGTRAMGIRVNSPAVTDRTQGYGEFGVMWNIPDQEANGYVIQHVRFFGNVTNCANRTVTSLNASPPNDYYEAWKVRNGRVLCGNTNTPCRDSDDVFNTGDERANTKGRVGIRGKVSFFPDYHFGSGWTVSPPNTHPAKDLPHRTSAPPEWNEGIAHSHRLTVDYDDCAGTASATSYP